MPSSTQLSLVPSLQDASDVRAVLGYHLVKFYILTIYI